MSRARRKQACREISDVLASWCRLVADERGIAGPPGRSLVDRADYLDRHVPWLLRHEAATCFVEELGELVAIASDALAAPVTACAPSKGAAS
jgi:hypothetical protein